MRMKQHLCRLSVAVVVCLSVFLSPLVLHSDPLQVIRVSPSRDLSSFTIEFSSYNRVKIPEEADVLTIEPHVETKIISSTFYGEWTVQGNLKPNTDYVLTLKSGLKNTRGDTNQEDIVYAFRTNDMSPTTDIVSQGPFFPANRPNFTIPLYLINVNKLKVQLEKVYNDNIIPYKYNEYENRIRTEKLGEKEIQLDIPVNTPRYYSFDLASILPNREKGIYRLIFDGLKKNEDNQFNDVAYDSCFIVVSNLIITGATDNTHDRATFFIRDLNNAAPVQQAKVKLYTRNNRLIGEGESDRDGKVTVTYSPDYKKNTDFLNVVTAEKDGDFTFLYMDDDISHCTYSSSIFNNEGGRFKDGPAAFVYTERGVARPGETITISAIIRNDKDKANLPAVADTPFSLFIITPDGNEAAPIKLKTDKYGFASYAYQIPQDARTGRYSVSMGPDKDTTWGEANFIVSTYVPDRIKVNVTPERVITTHEKELTVKINGKYYFGADIADGASTFRVTAEIAKPPAHWKGYTVGDEKGFVPGKSFVCNNKEFNGEDVVTFGGFNSMEGKSFNPVELLLSAEIKEPGGRAVTNNVSIVSLPNTPFLGLQAIKSNQRNNNILVQYEVLAYDKDTKVQPLSQPVTFTLFMRQWDYIRSIDDDGRLRHKWTETLFPVAEPKTVTLADIKGAIPFNLPESGSYELVATCGDDIQTRLKFNHWWGEGGAKTANPAILSFTTDKDIYMPGDTAKVTFSCPGKGTALIVCGEDGLESSMTADIVPGDNTITVAIPASLTTEAYHAAITTVSHLEKRIERNFGLLTLKVNQDTRKLNVSLDIPGIVRPTTNVKIKATVTKNDGKPASGLIHIFAVDEGILSLTNFKTPDIFDFFHGKRYFLPDFYDNYNNIFPDLRISDDGKIGGGADGEFYMPKSKRNNNMKSALFVLPPMVLSQDGTAETIVQIPEHLGSMRLMAVCSDPEAVGSGDVSFIVRDPISVMPSGPVIVSPSDDFQLTFTLFNHDFPGGECAFSVLLPNALKTEADVNFPLMLAASGSTTVTLHVKATDILGDCMVKCVMKMADYTKYTELPISIRSNNPKVAFSHNYVLQPGQSKTFVCNPMEWYSDTTKSHVMLTASPAFGLEESLEWLNGYPYGCLEQTTSKAFPFLFLDSLLAAGVISDNMAEAHRQKLFAARDRIMTMSLADGSFSLWPEHRQTHLAASIYATHFLVEASLKNVPVNEQTLKQTYKFLLGIANDGAQPRMTRAYCAYILAIAKQKSFKTVAENILKTPQNDYAAFLASAALIKGGYPAKAMDRFQKALDGQVWFEYGAQSELFSKAARFGMSLSIIMDIAPDNPSANAIAGQLHKLIRPDGQAWGTTQSNAWATGALAKYAAYFKLNGNHAATVQMDKEEPRSVDAEKIHKWNLPAEHVIVVKNTGDTAIFLQHHLEGIPKKLQPTPAGVMIITREYLNEAGETASTFKQGELVTVKITLESMGKFNDLVFTDILPGGLEIEDPNLATRAAAISDEKAKRYGILEPKFIERRDNRYHLFGDLNEPGIAVVTYKTRAVTRGTYNTPPCLVEAMYIPDVKATYVTDMPFEVK